MQTAININTGEVVLLENLDQSQGGGGTGSGFNIDGGYAGTVYIAPQLIDGGDASGD